nr:DUF1800 family protein [Xanthomonas translucens]
MARTFQHIDGDIAAVLQVLFAAREMAAEATHKFKDRYRLLVSSLRLAYEGQTIVNPLPLLGWRSQMGEPSYGRIRSDGWPLQSSAWNSSGPIARAIGGGNNQLFTSHGPLRGGFPQLPRRCTTRRSSRSSAMLPARRWRRRARSRSGKRSRWHRPTSITADPAHSAGRRARRCVQRSPRSLPRTVATSCSPPPRWCHRRACWWCSCPAATTATTC